MYKPVRTSFGLLLALSLGACQTYEARPLDVRAILAELSAQREDAGAVPVDGNGPRFTILDLAKLMRERSPALMELRAELLVRKARAAHRSPLPNPAIGLGFEHGSGRDLGGASPWAPLFTLSLALPLGDRRGAKDELDQARLDAYRAEITLRLRSLELRLRRDFAELRIARKQLAIAREAAQAAQVALDFAKRSVEAGQGTGLDVSLLGLDLLRAEALVLEAGREESERRATLAGLCGISSAVLAKGRLVDKTESGSSPQGKRPWTGGFPARSELLRLLERAPALELLKARYAEREQELKLEIAKQYPDLVLGSSFSGDSGERKTLLGLSLGIALPLFDRNQEGIAVAHARREQTRVAFEAKASSLFTEVDVKRAAMRAARARFLLLQGRAEEYAKRSVSLAKKAVEAGTSTALAWLEAQRGLREIQLSLLRAERDALVAQMDLEILLGRPLPTSSEKEARTDESKGSGR